MSIKLIAFDVDGTFVGDDHLTINEKNIEAMKMAHEQGIKVVMSTGRTQSISQKEIDDVGCVDYMVLSNGAIVVDKTTNDIDAAVNTPRNMFVYNIENGMYYLRAARIENVNEGTLFYQNIRLMKNPNTKERTVYFSPNNQNEVLGALEINLDGFKPGTCYFDPNGGIYWSYMSHTPDQIILNGCGGDTYYINRKLAGDKNMFEWIKYTNK